MATGVAHPGMGLGLGSSGARLTFTLSDERDNLCDDSSLSLATWRPGVLLLLCCELQIFAVRSSDAVSTEAPSAENAAEIESTCVTCGLQMFAVRSSDAVNTEAPSAENTAELE